MGIRIQPREVVIPDDPDDEPFRYDLLGRREKAEVLTSLVSNIDGPCAMAVDAAWGAGKTTFLNMWAQHLRNEGFPVVIFNAWETDASGDPLVALTTEITEQLRGTADTSKLDQVSSHAKDLIRKLAPGLIRFGTGFVPIAGSELGHTLSAYAEEVLAGHGEAKQSAKQFKDSLQELASALWEAKEQKPTVILIDELDRCRPSYAIELLETAKHIFGVDHVVFVLAVNREQLAHSVKALYGSDFDAEGYLRRFFDIDFGLPPPNREAFIENMLRLIGVDEFLESCQDTLASSHRNLVYAAISLFLGTSSVSLRSIGQSIHRFGVVLTTLSNQERTFLRTLTVLTILNAVSPSVYRKFINYELTAKETLDALHSQYADPEVWRTQSGVLVEAVIVARAINRDDLFIPVEQLKTKAPLLYEYASWTDSELFRDTYLDPEVARIRKIHETLMRFFDVRPGTNEPLGFRETVQRLELL